MSPLPYADPATRRSVLAWLETFSGYVRTVDYAGAAPMFHPNVLAFGTHRNVIPGLEAWIHTQWDKVWPKTTDFRFDFDGTHILAAADGTTATAVAPWMSTGYHPDGTAFDRPGRATMVFQRDAVNNWICVHSHMSLNRGVPQESHASRPVLAWPDAAIFRDA